MSTIIIPDRYGFFNDEQRALDLVVDKLTRDFDMDTELRAAMPEHMNWAADPPKNWSEVGMPVWHGRVNAALLHFVRDMREKIAQYTLPTIFVPGEIPKYNQMFTLQEAWEENPVIQERVKEYETALQDSYFEFSKKTMSSFLSNVAYSRALPPDSSKKLTELHTLAQGFKSQTYVECDHIYYRVAGSKLKHARELGNALKDDDLGRFFVLSMEEEKQLLATYERVPKKKPKKTD